LKFEEIIHQCVHDEQLQAEDQFIRKAVELEELLSVRHLVFIIGGAGKTRVWKASIKASANKSRPCNYIDLNPKAVTNNELYGFLNPVTRDWQDRLLSVIMRNLSKLTNENPKWITLDNNIDPNWIESSNTAVDDNKVLTLACFKILKKN
jgi:dynein heavy chain